MDTTSPQNPILDALAWFILTDEAHIEDGNEYWLQGRNLSAKFFASHEHLQECSKRHEARMETQDWPEHGNDFSSLDEALPATHTAKQMSAVQKFIETMALIPSK